MAYRYWKVILAAILFSNSTFADHMVSQYPQQPTETGPLDNLVIVSNPYSPRRCGVDVLEIGFKNDKMPNADFHIALMRDTYDPSFGPIPPMIRKIYDYNMPHDMKFWSTSGKPQDAEEPYPIVNRTTHKKQIVAKLVWDIAQFFASSIPFFGIGYYITDELVETYVRRNQYHRRQTTHLLNTIIEHKPEALQGVINVEELQSIIAVGEEYSLAGLFLNPAVSELVWQYNQDARHAARAQNYSRILNILNREGLSHRMISPDYLVVYYDPNRKYAREFNTLYTDIDELPKISDRPTGATLIPIGIYAIGQLDQRILTVDFTDSDRIRNRKVLKYMVDLGVRAGVSFSPLPYSLMIFATDKLVRFALNKKGTNIFTDIIDTEAELAMILQTGIAQLSPELIESAKRHLEHNQLNALLRWDGKPESNRQRNIIMTENFLKYHGNELCEEVDSNREKEYRENFLTFWERTKRFFNKLLPFVDDSSLKKEREKIISERFDILKARQTLRYFDPTRRNATDDDIVEALRLVSMVRDSDDTQLIARLIEYPGTETIELAAIRAARIHRHPDLLNALMKFLNSYDYDSEILRNDVSLSTAYQAIAGLDYQEANQPVPTFEKAIRFIEEKSNDTKLAASKNDFSNIKNKITYDMNTYTERQWQGY